MCFADLTVNSITPDGFIEVRSSNERQIYAVFADPNANIKPGDRVDITGTVTRGPGSTNNLDEKGAQTLMAQPYYVQIERIDITTDRAPQVPPPPAPPTEK